MQCMQDVLGMQSKIDQFFNLKKNNLDLPIILWGSGNGCEWFLKFMHKYSIPVACIIDQNKNAGEKYGMTTMDPLEAYKTYGRAIVVISAMAYKDEIEESIAQNMPGFLVVSFDPTLEVLQQVTNVERREYIESHKNELHEIEQILEDKKSKTVFSNVIAGAITSDIDYYKYIAENTQYFPDIIKEQMSEEEIFVDVGAYTGDSIQEFMDAVNHKYKKIYAFEPDEKNMEVLRKNIAGEQIILFQKGVGKNNGKAFFLNDKGGGGNEAAHVVKEKNEAVSEVEIVRLDDAIQEKCTYIKMDIEGMELDALAGAECLIRQYKPKMAISVYHRMEDMVEIPQFILNLDMGYKLYLRHYWNCNGTDTVLFAI